ncbi:uncharacterized protein METZ01_LOCUS7432 [marine metagenome]|uniref:Uncharacterized protein n=1 Tax=marine metagenome TaxID=408172 RepID=A0A381NL92_9ZZZZ
MLHPPFSVIAQQPGGVLFLMATLLAAWSW